MSEYLISIEIEKLGESGYLATSDTLQGLIAQGILIAETREVAQDVARKLIEHGDNRVTSLDALMILQAAGKAIELQRIPSNALQKPL